MAMPKAQRFEHAHLRVQDLSKALEFYTEIMGLIELGRDGNTVYLGCGLDNNCDLIVSDGGVGLVHFAVRLQTEDELERYERRLKEAGVSVQRMDNAEPGVLKGIRFTIPSGHQMELVLVESQRYLDPAKPARLRTKGFGPLDADHINLVAPQVKESADFFVDVLGFKLSDIIQPDPQNPDFWVAAWMRLGEYHHDVAYFRAEDARAGSLHHVAFTLSDFEHFKRALDLMAAYGLRAELGPSRHPVGSNLFVYFWEPGGNRFELSAEMAIVEPSVPYKAWRGMENTLDEWGQLLEHLPPSFRTKFT